LADTTYEVKYTLYQCIPITIMSQKIYYFHCPHCSKKQEFSDPSIQGKKVSCADCGGKTLLPEQVDFYMKPAEVVKLKSTSSKAPVVVVFLLLVCAGLGWAYVNDWKGFQQYVAQYLPKDVVEESAQKEVAPVVEKKVVVKEVAEEAPVEFVEVVEEEVVIEPEAEPVVVAEEEVVEEEEPLEPVHAGDAAESGSQYSAGMPVDYAALGIDEEKAAKGFDYLADQNEDPRDKRDGFMIVTTEDLKERLKNLPAYIYSKSEKSGFRVYLTTEKDWAGKSERAKLAAERKAFSGRVHALEILDYLKSNYKRLGLKYVIFIGDARPDEGTIPMLRVVHHQRQRNYIKEIDNGKESEKLEHIRKYLIKEDGHFTEYGTVISDYPFVDLDTEWDANGDGFMDSSEDESSSKRTPEIYVGRVPYYGEDSKYGKAADVDVVLNRFIRYDNEQDISWRYNLMYEFGSDPELQKMLEENGFNYEQISRFKSNSVGLPSITSRKGHKHIPNFEQIQNYSTGMLNRYSHGGAFGMEGFRSGVVASKAHDKHPTVMTLGACSIGDINQAENLVYTLLRFQSVAVSGGTGSVTGYGGNTRKVDELKMSKTQQLLRGKSFGEAHWEWYGTLYENYKLIPMTPAKINIYGDPSVIPFRYGANPPYPFLAKPVIGMFDVARDLNELKGIDAHEITLSSNAKSSVDIQARTNADWLELSKTSFTLRPGTKAKLIAKVDVSKARKLGFGVHEAVIYLSSKGYQCRRRFVIKLPHGEVRGVYPFEGDVKNVITGQIAGHGQGLVLPKTVTKYDPKKHGEEKPVPFLEDRGGKVSNNKYPIGGYIEPFEKEDFTIATWLKVDEEIQKPARGEAKQVLLYARDFFELYRDKTGLNLTLTTYAEIGEESDSYKLDSRADIELGKWHHIAISLDQTKGNLSLWLDGKEVGKKSVKRKAIYATTFMSYGQFKGASDELMLFSYVLPDEEFKGIVRGDYAYRPSPADGEHGLSPRRVKLTAAVGGALRKGKVALKNVRTRKVVEIEPNDKGEWIATDLSEDEEYEWKIVGEEGGSTVWKFYTGEELLKNGDFERGTSGWSGDVVYSERSQGMRVGEEALTTTRAKFEKQKVYKLQGLVRGRGNVGLVARSGGSKQVVASAQIGGPKYRFAPFEIALPVSDGDFIGEYARLQLEKIGTDVFEVSKLSLVAADAGDMNFPPVASSELEDLNAVARVGVDGFQVVLTDYVTDPEDGILHFTIVDGPSWAYIQGDDTLFSNYGPPAEDVGEHIFKILVEDDKGNSIHIDIPVTVRR
jgi:hypothetical protein